MTHGRQEYGFCPVSCGGFCRHFLVIGVQYSKLLLTLLRAAELFQKQVAHGAKPKCQSPLQKEHNLIGLDGPFSFINPELGIHKVRLRNQYDGFWVQFFNGTPKFLNHGDVGFV